jgi:hypothetical protein
MKLSAKKLEKVSIGFALVACNIKGSVDYVQIEFALLVVVV